MGCRVLWKDVSMLSATKLGKWQRNKGNTQQIMDVEMISVNNTRLNWMHGYERALKS